MLEVTVNSMATDTLAAAGLAPVNLSDRAVMAPYFDAVAQPLSDYTFSQVFTWRNSLRLGWRIIRNHLCIFANGSGDLTLLLPPMGDTGGDAALSEARQLMDAYNADHDVPDRTRVEYVSEWMLSRFDRSNFDVQPMGGDYVYDVTRMIDLAGGDLKSKRQEKNRFSRNYVARVETYDANRHLNDCLRLLHAWRDRQDTKHAGDTSSGTAAVKRHKEALATEVALCHAKELGLGGMLVWVADETGVESVKGFTFGELLGGDQSSIVIEKTDLEIKGLSQFIFSEFCRLHWAHRPLVNAGDDWGLESLAWTKNSYRPVTILPKYAMRPKAAVQSTTGWSPEAIATPAVAVEEQAAAPAMSIVPDEQPIHVRVAQPTDLEAIANLESRCFDTYSLSRRRLQYLAARSSAVVLVAENDGQVVGEAVGLLRHHKKGLTGRIYSLVVDPAMRGRGVGRQLMADLLVTFAQRGVGRVYLEVERTNAGAVALYEKLGFRSIGTIGDYYGDGRDALHMMCEMGVNPRLLKPLAA